MLYIAFIRFSELTYNVYYGRTKTLIRYSARLQAPWKSCRAHTWVTSSGNVRLTSGATAWTCSRGTA